MSPAVDKDRTTEHKSMDPAVQHLDEALADKQVPEFEDELELWTTYGGD